MSKEDTAEQTATFIVALGVLSFVFKSQPVILTLSWTTGRLDKLVG